MDYSSGHIPWWAYPEKKVGPAKPRTIVCARCSESKRVANLGNIRRYCDDCDPIARVERGKAQAKVSGAIRRGRLPRPDIFKCSDCDAKADRYDHRSYARPLDVAPVCRACNHKRGPAIWKAA